MCFIFAPASEWKEDIDWIARHSHSGEKKRAALLVFNCSNKLQSQTKVVGKVAQQTVVHFNPEKREFSLLLNIPRPPYSMLGEKVNSLGARIVCF